MNTCLFTSFSFSYLQRARILAKTVKAAHPQWVFWAVIVDLPPSGFSLDLESLGLDNVIYAHQLGIARFHDWIVKHDVVEACTAVKGHMLIYLLDSGYENVVYLDPDIAVFHPLSELESNLEQFSIILTPHQTEQSISRSAFQDNEATSLRYGVFNLGFLAVRNDTIGKKFAQWWAERLYEACYDAPELGIFTDQKYCDLVPALFPSVMIERCSGYNVASWNLHRRTLSFRDGSLYSNDAPLQFFHFTKALGIGATMISRYADENLIALELLSWYRRCIAEFEIASVPKGYWYYACRFDGSLITRDERQAYRTAFR